MYPSRITGVGIHCGDPIVSFTLSSKSIPYRELRFTKNKTRINVFPKIGFENHPTNDDPEVDHYSCIVTGGNKKKNLWAVTFNGHMSKRTHKNLEDGMNPFMALDLTLLDFRGAPNDARIGGIAYVPPSRDSSYWLGISDTDTREKRIKGYPNHKIGMLNNHLFFVYDKNTNLQSCFEMDSKKRTEEELAKYIHENIIGEEILFGLATGIAILRNGKFRLGIYNNNFDELTVERWKEDYENMGPKISSREFIR